MKVKCPFCDAVSYSIVEYKTSLLGYLVAILSILIFGFLSIILMPFLVSLTKSALHRCAKCLNEVKSNSYFGFSSLEDKVWPPYNLLFVVANVLSRKVWCDLDPQISSIHSTHYYLRSCNLRVPIDWNRTQPWNQTYLRPQLGWVPPRLRLQKLCQGSSTRCC